MRRLHLASASQRRLNWIKQKFDNFEITSAPLLFEEPKPKWGAPVKEQVEFSCLKKAQAAAREGFVSQQAGHEQAEFVMVSDTIVSDPDDPLMPMGKPDDGQHAMAMLLRLSGNRHRVWSSTALIYPSSDFGEHQLHGGWTADFWTESAVVEFDELSEDRLLELVSSESWKGKAGAYDLAGAVSEDTRLLDGEEVTVLGFAPSAIKKLESL